jgi:primosomal protein N' (replication factor Y)
MFPQKSVRLDGDNISSFKQLSKTLTDFHDKKTQILIGTQLIAKGLHFPGVTFVGIMGIDNVIAMPEFRSMEKAYQLLMQVSGRAGRGDDKGTVHIQSFMPEHPIFEFISTEPESFYKYELERRQTFAYPPYVKLARLILSHSDERELRIIAAKLVDTLMATYKNAKFMGPSPAVIFKIKNRYRMSVLIKSSTHRDLGNILHNANKIFEGYKKGSMQMKLDRDPYFFM